MGSLLVWRSVVALACMGLVSGLLQTSFYQKISVKNDVWSAAPKETIVTMSLIACGAHCAGNTCDKFSFDNETKRCSTSSTPLYRRDVVEEGGVPVY
jgi:hypothetical protein